METNIFKRPGSYAVYNVEPGPFDTLAQAIEVTDATLSTFHDFGNPFQAQAHIALETYELDWWTGQLRRKYISFLEGNEQTLSICTMYVTLVKKTGARIRQATVDTDDPYVRELLEQKGYNVYPDKFMRKGL